MKPMPRRAFAEVSGFEAKKHNIRQTTDGLWQLTLTVSEFGNADWLVFAPVGLPMAIGLNINFLDAEVNFGSPSSQWWIQLSNAMVFGVMISFILTLIITPCLIYIGEKSKIFSSS